MKNVLMKKRNFVPFSEARVKIFVGKKEFYSASEGNGPIHALDNALRKRTQTILS